MSAGRTSRNWNGVRSHSGVGTRSSVASEPASGHDENQDVDDDFGDDSLNEIIMAIDVRMRGTVGCAYYVAKDQRLYCMEDVKLGGPNVVEQCI